MMNEVLLVLVLTCKESPNCRVEELDSLESKAVLSVRHDEEMWTNYEVLPIKGAGSNKVEGLAIFKQVE